MPLTTSLPDIDNQKMSAPKWFSNLILFPSTPLRGASLVAQRVKCLPFSEWDLGSIPRLERSAGEGNGHPLQSYCPENPVDRGAWQATVHGVTRVGHDLATKEKRISSLIACLVSLLEWQFLFPYSNVIILQI